MPPYPPTSTLLLLELPPSLLIGIDLLTFTTPASGTFLGIHSLPSGWHFLFVSSTTSVSPREGFWFHIDTQIPSQDPKRALLARQWDDDTGSLLPCGDGTKVDKVMRELSTDQEKWNKSLLPYRQPIDPSPWPKLTDHLSPPVLHTFTSSPSYNISTTSCAAQDREPIPGLNNAEIDSVLGERELGVLGIDLKRTWPEGAVGRERTEKARDRSWALEDVERRWWEGWLEEDGEQRRQENGMRRAEGDARAIVANGTLDSRKPQSFGETTLSYFQVTFLSILLLQNYSALCEWKRILALVLTCKSALLQHPNFFARFLETLKLQLERMDDVEGGLFDMLDSSGDAGVVGAGSGGGGNYLLDLLKGFRGTVKELSEEEGQQRGQDQGQHGLDGLQETLSALEAWCREAYGWEFSGGDARLRSGVVELEDGENVYLEMERDIRLEEEEETGDWAPVIVEIQS